MRASNSRSSPPQQGSRAAWAALAVGWLILAWPWLSGRVTIPWDAKAQFLPQLQFLAASWANGDSPAWAPYVFSGHPQIADPQSLIFSPAFAALAWFDPAPGAWAADVTTFVMILVGATAMVAWLGDRGLHPTARALAALSFTFGAAMAWRIQHIGQVTSLAFLPITLFFLDRAIDRRSIAFGAAAGAAAACLVLGRDQVALLAVYLLVAHVISRVLIFTSDRRASVSAAAAPLGSATLVGAGLIALPILMTWLIASESNRPHIDFEGAGRGSLHPALFLTLLAPDVFGAAGHSGEHWGPPSGRWPVGLFIAQNMGQLYLGALPALLLVWGAASGVLWRAQSRVFAIAFIVAVIYALGWYTPGFAAMHAAIPGVDLYRRPADAAFLIGFLASALAAHALHAALEERAVFDNGRAAIATVAIIGSAFALMVALAMRFGALGFAWPGIALPAVVLILSAIVLAVARTANGASRSIATATIAAALIADLSWSNRPNGSTGLPPAMFEVLDPASRNDTIAVVKQRLEVSRVGARRDRAEIVGFGFHWPNAALTHGIETTLGYNPLRLGLYAGATGAGDTVGLTDQKTFSPLYPGYRSTLARLLGVSTIATSAPIETIDRSLRPGDVTLVARTADGYVYDNPGAYPRAMFASKALSTDFDELIASGAWPHVDYETTVLLEAAGPPVERRPGSVTILEYRNNAVTLLADSPDGGWVVLNDVWQRWWTATIDGEDTPLLRANGLFRAVATPPGRHTIRIAFEPVRGAMRQLAGSDR